MTNFADVYADTRAFLISQVRDLDPASASTMVPGTPEWSVKDTVAHVAGLIADLIDGREPPFGTPEMTARQVSERAEHTIAEICDEWASNADRVAPLLADRRRFGLGFTGDLTVHCHDIAEAVVAVEPPPVSATMTALTRYVPLLQDRVADRCDIALQVTLGDRSWEAGGDGMPMRLSADPVDLLLSVAGRRTRVQVESQLTFDGDATAILDSALLQYGPYRAA